jgi:hypothetical protein
MFNVRLYCIFRRLTIGISPFYVRLGVPSVPFPSTFSIYICLRRSCLLIRAKCPLHLLILAAVFMALGWLNLWQKLVAGIFLGGKGRLALKADNLTAICEPII